MAVTWDGEWLVAVPSNKASRFALLGPGGEKRLMLHREQVASVKHKGPTLLTNGTVTVEAHNGRSYQMHYRRKAADGFSALAADLLRVARPRPVEVVEVRREEIVPTPSPAPSHPLRRAEAGWQAAAKGQQPSVEEIARQLRLEEPRLPLDEQVEVPNEQFHTKQIRRVFRDAGIPITAKGSTLEDLVCVLVPEPWNEFDPNAVAVLVGGHKIGHLPADLAEDYAPGLGRLAAAGTLTTGVARIWAKSDGGMVRARATLLLPEADVF